MSIFLGSSTGEIITPGLVSPTVKVVGNPATPSAAADLIIAGSGDDSVASRDRATEQVRCGIGRDRGVLDRRDHPSGCERVRYGRAASG